MEVQTTSIYEDDDANKPTALRRQVLLVIKKKGQSKSSKFDNNSKKLSRGAICKLKGHWVGKNSKGNLRCQHLLLKNNRYC